MNFRSQAKLPALRSSVSFFSQLIKPLIWILVIATGIGMAYWWRVKKVSCSGGDQLFISENCSAEKLLQNKSLLTLDLSAEKWPNLNVITDNQQRTWSLASWSKQLPQTVKLNYVISPIQYITVQASQAAAVTSIGRTQAIEFKSVASQNLPVVTVAVSWPKSIMADGLIEPAFDTWVKQVFQAYLTETGFKPGLNLIDEFTATLNWPDWQLTITPMTNPVLEAEKFKLVQASLAEKTESLGKNYKALDVRFKLPVLIPIGSGLAPALTATKSASKSAIIAIPTHSATKSASPTITTKPKTQD